MSSQKQQGLGDHAEEHGGPEMNFRHYSAVIGSLSLKADEWHGKTQRLEGLLWPQVGEEQGWMHRDWLGTHCSGQRKEVESLRSSVEKIR